MGSYSYDRDVYSGSSYSNWGTSSISASKLSNTTMPDDMDPKNKSIVSNSKSPIIIALDVTGSNIDFARLIYDKLPMFYGEIEKKGYLKDFDVCICAIGDAKYDSYPIQIGTPAKGLEIDNWIEKLVLESGGGGNSTESYELMAEYLSNKCEFSSDAKPIVFFIADESAKKYVDPNEAKRILGIDEAEKTNPWEKLNSKFDNNVYCMLNKYCGTTIRSDFIKSWRDVLPSEHLIQIKEEKAIVDLMLGILALQKEDLKVYALDMKNRGQSNARIEGVRESLALLESSMEENTSIDKPMQLSLRRKTSGSGTRL